MLTFHASCPLNAKDQYTGNKIHHQMKTHLVRQVNPANTDMETGVGERYLLPGTGRKSYNFGRTGAGRGSPGALGQSRSDGGRGDRSKRLSKVRGVLLGSRTAGL